MFSLFSKKKKTEGKKLSELKSKSEYKKQSLNRPITPLDRLLAGEKVDKEEFDRFVAEGHVKREQRKAEEEKLRQEVLEHLGYVGMDLEQMMSEGYRRNMRDGVYVHDYSAPPGSIDNPREVGMAGCCTSLAFVPEHGGWVLTDGLGNGVSR